MDVPTISVVVPCFNVAAYVAEALESVLAQRRPVHEVIVVDDGSTDGTQAVLAGFQNVPGVKVFRTANQGLGPARNFGLERATGEYVYFLDSDDLMASSFSDVISGRLTSSPNGIAPDLVCFSGKDFLDDGYESDFSPQYTRRVIGRYDGVSAALALSRAHCFFPNAYLYVSRRALWTLNALRFKPIIYEDVEVLIPLFAAASHVDVIDDVLYHRRVRRNSIMTSGLSSKALAARHVTLRSLLAYPVERDPVYRSLEAVVERRLSRTYKQYLATADRLRLPLDWRLVVQVAWRLRNREAAKKLARAVRRYLERRMSWLGR